MKDKAKSKLRVHVYTMCWNEEVILPHFLRHYSGFEKVVVYDHESTDDTHEILNGVNNVELRTFKTKNIYSNEVSIDFRNNAWKESRGKADFVIVCDSDEFLYHADLPSVLQMMRSQGATVLLPMAYQMVGVKVPKANEDLLSVVPNGVRLNNYDKCILFDPNQIDDIHFKIGSHVCNPTGNVKYFRIPGLVLLHYKFFTPEYVFARNQLYTKRAAQAEVNRDFSPHHRLSYQQIKDRYETLYTEKIDVIAKSKLSFEKAKLFEWRTNLKNDYKLAINAFKKYDYKTALKHLEIVAEWQPARYRIGAMLTVILRSRNLFLLESIHVKTRTESMALSSKPRFNVFYDLAKFYQYVNHPRYALHYVKRASELKPKHNGLDLLKVKINKSLRITSEN